MGKTLPTSNVKLALGLVTAVMLGTSLAGAQVAPLRAGLYAGWRVSTMVQPMDNGVEALITPARLPDVGARLRIAVGAAAPWGFGADVSWSTMSAAVTAGNVDVVTSMSYVLAAPMVWYDIFTVGVAVGMPVDYRQTGTSPTVATGYVADRAADILAPLIEARFGVIMPVIETDMGDVDVAAHIGVMVGDAYRTDDVRTLRLLSARVDIGWSVELW